jgi:fatty-acyl-CoA synthase
MSRSLFTIRESETMNTTHYKHWPAGLPYTLTPPETSLYVNLEISARRYPGKAALIFYDAKLSYAEFDAQVRALAGYLQQDCGVRRGDRVLLNMQNSPQFIIGYYAILRADAMVVPVNPMLMTDELRHYVEDSGAKVAITSQEIFSRLAPLVGSTGLKRAIVAAYSDYLPEHTELTVPDWVKAPRAALQGEGVVSWHDALQAAP